MMADEFLRSHETLGDVDVRERLNRIEEKLERLLDLLVAFVVAYEGSPQDEAPES